MAFRWKFICFKTFRAANECGSGICCLSTRDYWSDFKYIYFLHAERVIAPTAAAATAAPTHEVRARHG
jgi:hypothetical protein